MGLFYLHHILKTGECNPTRIEGLNNKFIGGFKNLIHGRDLTEAIIIRLDFDKHDSIGSNYSELAELFEDFDLGIESPSELAQRVGVEFEIRWSESRQTAYVAKYKTLLEGELISEVTSDSGLKQPVISYINYLHPLLLPEGYDEWVLDSFESELPLHPGNKPRLLNLLEEETPDTRSINHSAEQLTEVNGRTLLFSEESFVSEFHFQLNESRGQWEGPVVKNTELDEGEGCSLHSFHHIPISFRGVSGALPHLGRKLTLSLNLNIDNEFSDTRDEENLRTRLKQFEARAVEILSDVIVGPLDDLLKHLEQSLCIGPLRIVPDEQFHVEQNYKQGQWYDGSAAWHSLLNTDRRLLNDINHWLSHKDKLDLGYGLALRTTKAITEVSIINTLASDISSGLKQLPKDYSERFRVALWDETNELDVAPNEVGAGISQLMPLVVAALSRKQGMIACEQPELHVHPRIQVALGDLITQANSNTQFLIETHSEHLILRVLRRIRESGTSNYPTDFKELTTRDVSVISIEPSLSGNGSVIKKYEITDDGDFAENWPNGFFDERDEELF